MPEPIPVTVSPAPAVVVTGPGDAHTSAVASSQTKQLLAVILPFLSAGLVAMTAWLQSAGTSHEVTLKDALTTAVKEVIAGQQKQTDVIKQDVKAAPVVPVVVPPAIDYQAFRVLLKQYLDEEAKKGK